MIALLLAASAVLGTPPKNVSTKLSHVPNEQAIVKKIWFPGLDAGFTPQGLTFANGRLYVAGYKEGGSCHVFVVDPNSGRKISEFALPGDIKHAGGLASGGSGALYVVDKGLLYKLDFNGRVLGKVTLDGGTIGGSFAAARGNTLWVGLWIDDGASGSPRIYRLDAAKTFKTRKAVKLDNGIPIAKGTQGATVASTGDLWLTQSDSKYGRLQLVDWRTGHVRKSYKMTPGIEDISRSPDNRLWSVSEAGSMKWRNWSTKFPVIFAIDIGKLRD